MKIEPQYVGDLGTFIGEEGREIIGKSINVIKCNSLKNSQEQILL